MLIFGGFDGKESCAEIYCFHLILKWKLSQCKLPTVRQCSSYLVTPDQRYVLLFDGTSMCERLDLINFPQIKIESMVEYDDKDDDEIYELDIDEDEFDDEFISTYIPCVMMQNGDIYWMNCNSHGMTNILAFKNQKFV